MACTTPVSFSSKKVWLNIDFYLIVWLNYNFECLNFFIIIVFGRVFSNSATFMTKIKEQSVNLITGFCFQSLVITIITP